jgi:hypothetical protein
VLVLFFNSWGGDMSPGSPEIDPGAVGAEQPGGYERMQALGDVVADAVVPALDALTFSADRDVRARTFAVPVDRDAIGYAEGEFNYPNGGVFCGLGSEGSCESIMPIESLPRSCSRISPSDRLPHQTLMTAGRIGDLFFVTAPGEWGTALANGVLDEVRAESGSADAMMIGYANDYTGYSLGEVDWFQGGYEASGALWGPRQGEYLAARLVESFETFFDLWNEPPWWEPARVEPFSGYSYDPYVPERALDLGTIAADVPASATATDVVTFTVHGSDPWLGTPIATLERDDGTGAFVAVTRPHGAPVDSRGYDFWVDLTVDPPYTETLRATERTFAWTFHFPIESRAGSPLALDGAHRFHVRVPTTGGEMEVTTATFTVTP